MKKGIGYFMGLVLISFSCNEVDDNQLVTPPTSTKF